MDKRLERVLIIPQWEARGAESWTVYGEEEDGQVVLINTVDIGPFDTVGVITQKVVRALLESGYRVK